jgi:hypothetical protein
MSTGRVKHDFLNSKFLLTIPTHDFEVIHVKGKTKANKSPIFNNASYCECSMMHVQLFNPQSCHVGVLS